MDMFFKAVKENNQKAITFLFDNLDAFDCLNFLDNTNRLDAVVITDVSRLREIMENCHLKFNKAVIDKSLSPSLMNECLLLAVECERLDIIKYLIESKKADIFCIKSVVDNEEIESYLCEKRDDFIMV